jgi:drug/metabolite transporter (DMT)-like permease
MSAYLHKNPAVPKKRLQADLLLLLVAIIWGSAFVVQRVIAENSSVFLFNGLRFLLAGIILLPFAYQRAKYGQQRQLINKTGVVGIGIAGLILVCGAGFQQAGLRFTTAGNAGFITGLYVVLIPFIQALFLNRPTGMMIWTATILSAAGLFLLSTGGSLSFNRGDILELVGAIFWALHVIWIGHLANRLDGFQLAAGQYLVCGLVSVFLGLLFEPDQATVIGNAAWAILYTGIFSVALGYTLQIFGQKEAPPADAAIILSLEAVFAAVFGWIFLSEFLSSAQLAGCGIMLVGMILAQVNTINTRTKIPEGLL